MNKYNRFHDKMQKKEREGAELLNFFWFMHYLCESYFYLHVHLFIFPPSKK